MSRQKQQGFTLMETIIAAVLTVMALGLLVNVVTQSMRLATKVEVQGTNLYKMRSGFEQMNFDLQRADQVLCKYPNNNPGYLSNTTSTLILRIPKFDSNGKVVSGEFEVVIYKTSTPQNPGPLDVSGTKVLERYTASISGGIESAAVLDRTLSRNVSGFNLDYGAVETFKGDGWTTSWGLKTVPLATTTQYAKAILIGETDWALQGFGAFDVDHITFQRAPKWGVPIDVTYPVDPTVICTPEGGNAASSVNVRLTILNVWKKANSTGTTRLLEFQTRIKLRNL